MSKIGVIVATRKDSIEIELCAQCQLEVNENDFVCTNCGNSLRAITEELALESIPQQPHIDVAIHTNQANFQSKLSQSKHLNLIKDNRLATLRFKPKQLVIVLFSFLSLASLIYVATNYLPDRPLSVFSSPYLNSAIDKNKNFQSALHFYFKKHARWPETVESMQYVNLLNQQQNSYFVLTTEGDYYQILTAPFFLKGKTISWNFKSSANAVGVWECSSRDFPSTELTC